jgi:hypothetical protein
MEDCPICLEPMSKDNENCCMNGTNCEHKFCIPCYCKIIEDNKCAICRAQLEENESDDSDDETENIFTGNNTRPTTDLFLGRRWFNTETNRMEYFYCFMNENGLYNAWIDNIEKRNFSTFIQRYLNVGNIDGCCYICGVQRTTEVNEFMKNKYPNGFVNIEGDEWDDYFLDSSWHNNCYECSNMYHKLNHTFYS